MDWPRSRLQISCQAWQLVEQRLRFLQIKRVEAFGEPAVDRSKQFASLLRLALITPEAREAQDRYLATDFKTEDRRQVFAESVLRAGCEIPDG